MSLAYFGLFRPKNGLQEVFEDTLRPVVGQRVRVVPAGRTDAGVHVVVSLGLSV